MIRFINLYKLNFDLFSGFPAAAAAYAAAYSNRGGFPGYPTAAAGLLTGYPTPGSNLSPAGSHAAAVHAAVHQLAMLGLHAL